MTRQARFAVLVAALASLAVRTPAHAHGDVMRIGSSQPGSGQLLIEPDFQFDLRVFLAASAMAGGMTIYDSIFPSFTWVLEPRPAEGLYPLTEQVTVEIAIVSPIAAGASTRIAGRILDAPGESAAIGAFDPDPESHVHPEWRLILPDEVTGEYEISFTLTTSAPGYSGSAPYTLVLTNIEQETTPTPTGTPGGEETPTASPTATATATPPSSCAGDCNGDAVVAVAELIRAVALANGNGGEECPAADGNDDGTITIDEVVWAVRSALDGCETLTAE